MARFKEQDYSQGEFIPINFEKQKVPGMFEYTLYSRIDKEIAPSVLDLRYNNDEM